MVEPALNGASATAYGPLDFVALLQRLGELGPPSEIRNQSPVVAATALGFERVLLTSTRDGMLRAEALHLSRGSAAAVLSRLDERPVALEYPLIEGEIMRRRRAQIVRVDAGPAAAGYAFGQLLGWAEYIVAPVLLDGTVVGFFHADRDGAPLDQPDADRLVAYVACWAIAYERAVIRHRLRVQRLEMRQMASWADARAAELGDGAITLDEGAPEIRAAAATPPTGVREDALRQLLTPREFEILRLIVRGETNVGIARTLVVSEGTVKFHVKNILRKLHASNRAEAVSRYMRLAFNQ